MQLEVRIDRERCIGSGQCVFVAGGAFEQDQDAKAVVKDARGEPEEKIVHAVTACPVQAISLWVGSARVGQDDLKDWAHGARSGDALVELLAQLCDEHHELRTALEDTGAVDDERASGLTRDHLHNEDAAYPAIAALVAPGLVAAFEEDHADIDQAVEALATHDGDPARQAEARERLARAVADHIRLEETVLFPAALAALAAR